MSIPVAGWSVGPVAGFVAGWCAGGVVGCGCLVPGPSGPAGWQGWVGVGLLFEIWIVDASIKFFCSCVECASPAWCARCCVFHVMPCALPRLLGGGVRGFCVWGGGGWVGLVVCVTSCEGHMVDALAS